MKRLLVSLLLCIACGSERHIDPAGAYSLKIGQTDKFCGGMTLQWAQGQLVGQWAGCDILSGIVYGQVTPIGAVDLTMYQLSQPMRVTGQYNYETGMITGKLNDGFNLKDVEFVGER